jgi:hypothetical protein
MKAGTAIVVFVAIAAALAWLVLMARRVERQKHFERKVQARKLGWAYDDQRDGRVDYRFSGAADGIAWQMWHDSDRGDESPKPQAYWRSSNLRTPGLSLVIIGRRRYGIESGVVGRVLMGVVGGIAEAMTGRAAGSDKTSFYDSAIELPEGRPTFREHFAVVAAPDMPRGWVDDELQGLLTTWASDTRSFRSEDAVEINLGSDGLQVVVQRMPQEFANWAHLAQLGQHVAQKLIRAGAK